MTIRQKVTYFRLISVMLMTVGLLVGFNKIPIIEITTMGLIPWILLIWLVAIVYSDDWIWEKIIAKLEQRSNDNEEE